MSTIVISTSAKHELTRRSLVGSDQLEKFGAHILSCCLDRKDIFDSVSISLNYNNQTQRYDLNDFLNPVDALVYGGMLEFLGCWQPANPWPSSRAQWVSAIIPHLSLLFKKNQDFPEILKSQAFQRIMLLPPASPGVYDLICDGLVDYIMGVRYFKMEAQLRFADPAFRRKAYDDVATQVRIPSAVVPLQDNMELMSQLFAIEQPTKPITTGVRGFDYFYGKNAMGGDAWLFFGHPGGGKTNLGCQTTGFTAASGKLAAYITTEVKTSTLLLRCCSAQAGIPYSVLKGIRGDKGHPQAMAFENWVRGVGRNIALFDYRSVEGRDYKEKYKRILDTFYKKYGQAPDLIVWDWIGKALDSGFSDPWAKREAYNGVASMLVDSADELDNTTLTLAQASKETKNRVNITEQDTADSKSLADGMELACGITSLLDSSENNTSSQECHKDNQFLVVCKCREEQALRLAVKRRFDMARFESDN